MRIAKTEQVVAPMRGRFQKSGGGAGEDLCGSESLRWRGSGRRLAWELPWVGLECVNEARAAAEMYEEFMTSMIWAQRLQKRWWEHTAMARWLIVLAFMCCWAVRPLAAQEPLSDVAEAEVHKVRPPEGAIAPDVAVDAKGVIHMVYGSGENAFFVRSQNNGMTWSTAVKVNDGAKVSTTMGERGPKIAIGQDGAIHVVWADRWSAGVKVFLRHTRSRDGGKSFEPAKAVSTMPGVDGVTVAADAAGNVLAFWHVMVPVQREIPEATWVYMARSIDNGQTFAANERVKISNLRELACSMCMMRACIADDGNVYLALRGADKIIRDFWVLKGPVAKNQFVALRVNNDNWELNTCPMCGPELAIGSDGRALCAFMSRHKVYWAISDEKRAAFKLHVPTPSAEKDEIYPAAIANKKGIVLMVWQVGPMSVSGTAVVKWATYTPDGKPTGKAGILGQSFSGTKATVFVGTDDEFYVVTTAK